MQEKKILLINDICGHSNVATVAMMPILSYMGIPTSNIPTALVSNNFEYGQYNLLDTTEYMRGVFPVWNSLGFTFQAIATGFIPSVEQAELIADYCMQQAEKGTSIFVDPIMGDWGKLYHGVDESIVLSMRRMLSVAHLCVPNYTEACYLTDTPFTEDGVILREAYDIVDKLCAIGSRSVIITSMTVDGKTGVVGYNSISGEYFCFPYEEIPAQFAGTGDIFSSVLYGNILKGESLEVSVRKAMDYVSKLIFLCRDQEDKKRGIPIEKYLSLLP